MKKAFMVIFLVFLVFLMVGTASAGEWVISACSESPNSGNTVELNQNTTYPMFVSYVSGSSNIYIGDSKSGECIIQLKDIFSKRNRFF